MITTKLKGGGDGCSKTWITCNACGAKRDHFDTVRQAEADALADNWTIEGNRDLCPPCAKEEKGADA